MKRAVFLDRDATLMRDPGYTGDPDTVEILPGVPEALRRLSAQGYRLVIVTNQSAIARGYATPAEVESVNQRLVDMLAKTGVTIDAIYYCPHRPDDGCDCRKPQPGMLLRAADELGLNLSASVMIGDKVSDVDAGTAAGCGASVLLSADGAGTVARDLAGAAALVLDEPGTTQA